MTDSQLLARAAASETDRPTRVVMADAALAAHTIEQRDSRRCRGCGTPTMSPRWWCSPACHSQEDLGQ